MFIVLSSTYVIIQNLLVGISESKIILQSGIRLIEEVRNDDFTKANNTI